MKIAELDNNKAVSSIDSILYEGESYRSRCGGRSVRMQN